MKMVLIITVILIALGAGSYAYYRTCHGFNSCNNPACEHDCYENGVRVR